MAQSSEGAHQRIVIAGGGVAGLTLAVALKQALGESFRIIVADPALDRPAGADSRAYAVAAAARNAWATICPPYRPPQGYRGPTPTHTSGPWGSRSIIATKSVVGSPIPAWWHATSPDPSLETCPT